MKKTSPIRNKPLPFEFPGANWFDRQEEAAALRVIRAKSPFRYYGPKCGFEVDRLEEEFATVNGVKHALAISSGTQALAAAMAALGIGPGAEVIVPAYMWPADTKCLCWRIARNAMAAHSGAEKSDPWARWASSAFSSTRT